jgi:hypothetical protein
VKDSAGSLRLGEADSHHPLALKGPCSANANTNSTSGSPCFLK